MDLGISGKTALVSASSAGLGFASALALAEAGCKTVISGRNEERLMHAASKIPNSIPVIADVSTVKGSQALVQDAKSELGTNIDILITNAGGPPTGTFASTDVDQYLTAIELNLMSVVAMCKETVPDMQEKMGKSTSDNLNICSATNSKYHAFKYSQSRSYRILKTMALETAADGVTVNSIQPGLHATDRVLEVYGKENMEDLAKTVPAQKIGSADDFGKIAAFYVLNKQTSLPERQYQ